MASSALRLLCTTGRMLRRMDVQVAGRGFITKVLLCAACCVALGVLHCAVACILFGWVLHALQGQVGVEAVTENL